MSASAKAGTCTSIKPVFVVAKNVPEDTNVFKLCTAAERVSGPSSVDGATCISGLWRIHPLTETARTKLLTGGLEIEGKRVALEASNPFLLHEGGGELPATRLAVSNLPLSYSNDDILKNLTKLGIQLRSRVIMEKARSPDGSLSNWKTGRRIVWITLPARPLPRATRMGDCMSFLYYREMQENEITCRRCQQKGHKAFECPGQEMCFACNKPGHRRGDPECGSSLPGRHEDVRDDRSEIESTDEEDTSEDVDEDEESEQEDGEEKLPVEDEKKGKKTEKSGVVSAPVPEVGKKKPTGEAEKYSKKSDIRPNVEKDVHKESRSKLEDKTKKDRKGSNEQSNNESYSDTSTPQGSDKPSRSTRQSQLTYYLTQDSPQDHLDKEGKKRSKRLTPSTSPDVGSNGNPQQKPRLEKQAEK